MQVLPLLAPALLVAGLGYASRPAVAPAPAPSPAEAAAPTTWNIDPAHSFVTFRIDHLGIGKAYGAFEKIEGVVRHDAADPTQSSLRVVIDATTVNTYNQKRNQHLLGSDFLAAKEFPEIVFESKSVAVDEEGAMKITGDLTLHGVTKEVVAEASKVGEGEDPWGNQRIGFEGMIKIDRMAHGIEYMPDGLGKTVDVWIAIEAIREKAE